MFGQLIDDLNQIYSKLNIIYFFKTYFAYYTPYKFCYCQYPTNSI